MSSKMNRELKKILDEIKEIEGKLIQQPTNISLTIKKHRLEDRFETLLTYIKQ